MKIILHIKQFYNKYYYVEIKYTHLSRDPTTK